MAWFRNTDSSRTEPSAQDWGKKGYDSQGKSHSMLNYSSTVYTRSYMNQTERISRFGPVHDDHQINLFKDHGDDIYKHSHFPPIMVYPKKAEGFSLEERLKGAPWNSAGYKNHGHSTDDFDDHNYDRHEGYGGPYLPKPVHTKPAYDTDYGMGSPEGAGGKPSFVPPAGMHQQDTAPVSTSPKKATYPETARYRPIGSNPPRNKPETDTQSQKTSWKPLFEPAAASHPQYTAPVSTSPKKDAYHETSRNRPIGHSPPRSKPAHDNGKVSAHAMTRPGKEGHQQTIDCNEARERYGGISVNQPKPEKEYMGTIDCREAATKYNGVFVP